jgi:hypothetical protein
MHRFSALKEEPKPWIFESANENVVARRQEICGQGK